MPSTGEISDAFVRQFGQTVEFLVQQHGTRLRATIRDQKRVTGEFSYFDQIAATSAVRTNTRNADSPLIKTVHRRRRVGLENVEWGDLIDDFDEVRMLIDPTSPTSMNAGFAIGREIDEIILEAVFGDVAQGKTGATTVTWASATGQVVAVDHGAPGNTGLTVEKLREARRILLAANVDPIADGPFYIIVNAKALDTLLGTTEVTSADFNTVKTLVQGEIDTFLGFRFIHTELIPVNGTGLRRIPAYTSTALGLAMAMEPRARIAERADKRFSTYVYWSTVVGAVRKQEEKVIEILADES